MHYIVFENKGEIYIRTISTFGVSIKEGENPIGFFGTGTSKHLVPIELDKFHQTQWDRAYGIVCALYPDFKDYNYMFVRNLGRSTKAMALMEERKMVFSLDCFTYGSKFLVSTMLEEYAHLKTGYSDYTNGMQTWLFDQICTLAERHVLGHTI